VPGDHSSVEPGLWSISDNRDKPDVDALFLQPFLTKGLGKGRTLALNAESSYDWTREQWTVQS